MKVFINGSHGTTGLRLSERLSARNDIELITIDHDKRKDTQEIKKFITASDITFLCLPDAAALEAAALAAGSDTRIIDTSTAFRTHKDWAYGFPELSAEARKAVQSSGRVAVPGCHAGGFIALVYPLIASGLLEPDFPLYCTSVTGYSGGGKPMIAEYENPDRPLEYTSPRQYALSQSHKHLPEMVKACSLTQAPVFMPIVADYYSGIMVTVAVQTRLLRKKAAKKDFYQTLAEHYEDSLLIKVCGNEPEGLAAANELSGYDNMKLFVTGSEDRVLLHAVFDNLGKGASGAAIQCLNLMLGAGETDGLKIKEGL